ncbi:MAG TPA: pilin [Pseudonocardiaceae bacterium]|nr:pilin [Pseudonocardiaceae bacterium]
MTRPAVDAPTIPATSARSTGRRTALRRRLILITELAALAVLLSASAGHAETIHTTTQVLAVAGSVGQVLTNIRNWVMGILAGLATVFLSIGGVRYVMGGGDPGEIEKAKTAFKAAGTGYALAALAPLVVTVLQGIVGA